MMIGVTAWVWGYSPERAILKVQSIFVSIHLEPEMQPVATGSFFQGDIHDRGDLDEQPVHEVRIKSFAMGKFEVTFDEYDRFALATGRPFPDDHGRRRVQQPVINVSWQDAKDYADWLSRQTGKRYRLPSESEWEYAARSGGDKDFWAGTSNEEQLKDYAIYTANGQAGMAPVGKDKGRRPNAMGLYDMSGNVFEWVQDCVHENYNEAPTDGSAWLEANGGNCQGRILRGGSWEDGPMDLRVSKRTRVVVSLKFDNIGFRLAQDMEERPSESSGHK